MYACKGFLQNIWPKQPVRTLLRQFFTVVRDKLKTFEFSYDSVRSEQCR